MQAETPGKSGRRDSERTTEKKLKKKKKWITKESMTDFLKMHIDDILIFFGKKQNKIDIDFLSKIVNWQDKLEQIFPEGAHNLGLKYD